MGGKKPNGIHVLHLTYIFTFPEIVAVKVPPTFLALRNNIKCKVKNMIVHCTIFSLKEGLPFLLEVHNSSDLSTTGQP